MGNQKNRMKTFMLKCTAALLMVGLIWSACKKSSQSFESTGVIGATILLTCNGCPGGGYYIQFATDTIERHIDNSLAQFGITANTKVPVNVSVNWKPGNTTGNNDVIITALKVNN
jgi:hypothetical protein